MDSARDHAQTVLDYRLQLGEISFSVGGLAAAVVTLLVVWLLSRSMQRAFVRHAGERQPRSRAAIYTLSRLAKYVLYVVGLLLALSFLGIPTSRFAVLAGALGVGLGFGLQAIFSNFVSGIILLFERSLRVGDFVELESGLRGEVRDINIRSTLISTNDNIDILVPNSEFVSGRVVNWTHGDGSRRIRVPFGVAYGSDKELVKKAAVEAAASVPFTLALEGARRPQVWLVGFGDSSLQFELVVWLTPEATKRPGAVQAGYMWALETALGKYGLEVPFPQRDLHVRSLFGAQGEAGLALLRDAEAQPPAAPTADLADHERAQLAGNDALEDVEQAAREEAARRAADEAAEAGDEPPRDSTPPRAGASSP
ncbi:MAG TPA: mechanosensitive ion channel domain-containing protein [Thermoanaerobaculia bacterium]|nr:mechanosensitive ion channel domain-containing protein [Thermoanaerobaculia bacterium]